jgi:ketosteroid isomerase-like protein
VGKFVAYYADDATLLMPNTPALNGKDAIRAALKPMLADPNFSLTFQDTRAEASKGGDMVYTTGAYTMTVSDPKNPKSVTTDKGNYLTVFRKQSDGSWKAVVDMINSDLPLAKPAKTTSKRKRGRR